MKEPKLLTFIFLIFYSLFFISNVCSQITRGAAPGEIYISNEWFFDSPYLHFGIFHSTDNGKHLTPQYNNIETPPPGEMKIGKVIGDATPGALYNYGNNEFWVSFDEGVNWEYREGFPSNTYYISGTTEGIIFSTSWVKLHKSVNYGEVFETITDPLTIPIPEIGFGDGEFFGINGDAGIEFQLIHTYDYANTYTEIPIDSSVAFWQIGGHWPQISRGTEPGELYLVSWWPDYHYKIFHSIDTGYTWTQQYESDSISIYYWGVQYTAGREPGSFYVKRARLDPTFTHTLVYIDYSSDYGQTFTTYFHDLVPDFTSVNAIKEPIIKLTNAPNPFSNLTTFNFQLPGNAGNPKLNIYNIQGKRVRQFDVNGKNQQQWNGTGANGNPLPKGIYLYNITYNNTSTALQKAIILY
ncbi:MAG: T9SS type A sorting domain-containing protein [Bacteroidetes bacterium]|nr:T9SS type A sorting domain-containing protein [Bacteroidota bacterium]